MVEMAHTVCRIMPDGVKGYWILALGSDLCPAPTPGGGGAKPMLSPPRQHAKRHVTLPDGGGGAGGTGHGV